ncbi:hypothetical protein CERSUDRAFT_118052 [Gelatoporia subvermispora B]|uniref:Nudix hydrolase domain-containing protein n=1 Tax=Ceriporiopsis subvermispora (strain B) TaxID=914234 RepID=M2PCP1_CERS8|nr:hypothetical protein CERSUDRAFT_118052 [Gelatoporia subvermispora B]
MRSVLEIPGAALNELSDESRTCIERLRVHQSEDIDVSGYPRSKLAAVLVVLYENAGELRVLLTTRSKLLRAHPGQTALPGGKVDVTDEDVVHTARREAFEEVALPLDCPHLHTVAIMRPFVSSSKLLVTPVVTVLTDLSVLGQLKASEGEVSCIFTHPFEAVLEPGLSAKEPLVPKGSTDWPYEPEFHSTSDVSTPWGNSTYRMHRFRTSASPIKGLTSDILIYIAEVAYDKMPSYERYAHGQLRTFGDVFRTLEEGVQSAFGSGTATPMSVPVGRSGIVTGHVTA